MFVTGSSNSITTSLGKGGAREWNENRRVCPFSKLHMLASFGVVLSTAVLHSFGCCCCAACIPPYFSRLSHFVVTDFSRHRHTVSHRLCIQYHRISPTLYGMAFHGVPQYHTECPLSRCGCCAAGLLVFHQTSHGCRNCFRVFLGIFPCFVYGYPVVP